MKKIILTLAVLAAMTAILILLIPVEKKNILEKQYPYLSKQAENNDRTAQEILDNIEEYPDDIVDFYNQDGDFCDFVYNYPAHKYDYASMQFTDEELNSQKPPKLYMYDFRWCYQPMGGGYIMNNGCVAVSLTMAKLYLTHSGDVDPYKIAQTAENMGVIGFSGGIVSSDIKAVAEAVGLSAEEYRFFDEEQNVKTEQVEKKLLTDILDSGDVLMVGVLGEPFGAHAFLISDYNDEGFIINDPADRERSEKIWNYDELAPIIYYVWDISQS